MVRRSSTSGWCCYPRRRFKNLSRTRDFIEPSRTLRVETSFTVSVACRCLGVRFAAFVGPPRDLVALRFGAIPLLPVLRRWSVQRSDGAVEDGECYVVGSCSCPRSRPGYRPGADCRSGRRIWARRQGRI